MTGVSVDLESAVYTFLHNFPDTVEQQHSGTIQPHELPRSE